MDEKSEIFRVHSHADSDFDSEKFFSMDSDSDSEYFILTVSDSDTDSENFAIVTSDTDTDSDGVGVTVGVRCHRRALLRLCSCKIDWFSTFFHWIASYHDDNFKVRESDSVQSIKITNDIFSV